MEILSPPGPAGLGAVAPLVWKTKVQLMESCFSGVLRGKTVRHLKSSSLMTNINSGLT